MARITKPLTNTEIERAKPKGKDYTLSDGQGLYLLIKPTGARLWRFNYYQPFTNPRKRALLSVGKYPDISLAQARKVRDEYLALLAQDIDPQQHRKQQSADEQARRINTFLFVAEKWCEKKADEVLPKTLDKHWARLEKHLFPKLGEIPVSEITPKMLIEALYACLAVSDCKSMYDSEEYFKRLQREKKNALKERAKSGGKAKNKRTNDIKKEILRKYDHEFKRYKELGKIISKNDFARKMAIEYEVSETTIRNNWLKGYNPKI